MTGRTAQAIRITVFVLLAVTVIALGLAAVIGLSTAVRQWEEPYPEPTTIYTV